MNRKEIGLLSRFLGVSSGWLTSRDTATIRRFHISGITTFFTIRSRTRSFPTTLTTDIYLRQLLEGQLEAGSVVGDTFGGDALHGLLQDHLVADVGLHQVLEARRVGGLLTELEGEREGGMLGSGGKVPAHIFRVNMWPVIPSVRMSCGRPQKHTTGADSK